MEHRWPSQGKPTGLVGSRSARPHPRRRERLGRGRRAGRLAVGHRRLSEMVDARLALQAFLAELRPDLAERGEEDEIGDLTRDLLGRGTSAARQRHLAAPEGPANRRTGAGRGEPPSRPAQVA